MTLTSPQLQLPWMESPLVYVKALRPSIESKATQKQFGTGQIIWQSELENNKIFYILHGSVRLVPENGGKSLLLKANEWFGSPFQSSGFWKARASALNTEVLVWNTDDWQIESNPALTNFFQDNKVSTAPSEVEKVDTFSTFPYFTSQHSAGACLAMASYYLQCPTPLESVIRLFPKKDQSLRALGRAAEKMGLCLRKIEVDTSAIHRLELPALALIDDNHWILLLKSESNLIVANPLSDQPPAVFNLKDYPSSLSLWQVSLIQKQEKFGLTWFLPAIAKYRTLLFEVLFASLTIQVLGLGTPILTQVVIDKVMVQGSIPTLDVIGIALFSITFFEDFLGILRLFIFTHTARRLDLSLSAQLFRHLMSLPLAYFEERRVGDTVARVQELENIRQFMTGTALTVVLDAIFAVVYLALMIYYSIPLTIVTLSVLPLFAGLTLVSTPLIRKWLNESFNRNADSQSFLVETVTGIQSVKAHAVESVTRDRWEGLFARFVRTDFRANTTSNISSHFGDFLTKLSSLALLWVGAYQVINEQITVGQLIAFQMLSGRMTGPLLRLVQLWQNIQQVLLSVDRIGDILNTQPEAEPGTGLVMSDVKGNVTFDQVFFRYNSQQEPVLRGISFDVKPGMFVGVVGRSGSGKSTLSKLIQRLYSVESGRILVDEYDIKNADLDSLRHHIAVVLQEDYIFNSSVADNITLGKSVDLETVIDAARKASAHDFISNLSLGYETNVGERGTALSGGQRQRIALSRLFLSDAPILILDEATSALDSETEQQVLNNLRKSFSDRTIFMIAHRFAPLKSADLIVVLNDGVLAEKGTHQQLVAQGGIYAALYQRQQSFV